MARKAANPVPLDDITNLMETHMTNLTRFAKDESGATAIEYALIAAFMGGMLIIAMPFLANAIEGIFGRIGNKLNAAAT